MSEAANCAFIALKSSSTYLPCLRMPNYALIVHSEAAQVVSAEAPNYAFIAPSQAVC